MFQIIKKHLVAIFLLSLIPLNFLIIKHIVFKSSIEITQETIDKTAFELQNTIIPMLVSRHIENKVSIFIYFDDYTKRKLLTSSVNILNPVVETVQEDPFFKRNILYHQYDRCNLTPTVDIPKDSEFYSVLKKLDYMKEGVYYISCPFFIDHTLIGYVSGVYQPDVPGLTSPLWNELELIADIVEGELTSLF